MPEKKTLKVSRPNAFLYYSVGLLAGLYFRWFLGLKLDRSDIKGLKPPFFVLSGHGSWLDFLIVAIALLPHRINYMAAYNFFRDPVLKFLMGWMGVIPKNQFTTDNLAILKTKAVIGSNGIVGIFPHGCLSNEGRPGGFAAPGIAKLLKTFKVPVIAVQINGAYLSRPRWTTRIRRGRMEVKVTGIFNREELNSLSAEDIYSRVLRFIDFDDYLWQRKNKVTFKGKQLAEGVEGVLYKCPKCLAEFTLRSKGNILFCISCNNEALLNKQLFFEPGREDSIVFDGFDNWFDFQKESLLTEIHDPGFLMATSTSLLWNEPGKYGYQGMGHGHLGLTREALTYEGTVFGRMVTLTFGLKDILMVPYAASEYFEIARGTDIRRFVPDDVRVMMKWVLAIRLIRDTFYESKLKP
jgi:1-acyl-sn-glycerol-3-phosphate acyltransferase